MLANVKLEQHSNPTAAERHNDAASGVNGGAAEHSRFRPDMVLDAYELQDRYLRETGRVFLTGTQALVRLPLMQRRLDRAAGLNTAGFVSGYRGSPLGGYDKELLRNRALLDRHQIKVMPAVNEELAAAAIFGAQQVGTDPKRQVDGVFSIWYGKGPGVDRAGDAFKHGNAYGSSRQGGVLVVAGDDHAAVSSSMPHQSDVAFLSFFMPHLNPADIGEYLSFGLYGIALSRFSGCWVGFKAISETVESARSLVLPEPPQFVTPNFQAPPNTLHYRWPDKPGSEIEVRILARKAAVLAFAKANPLDRRVFDVPHARYGIVTTGKGHLDLMEALHLLGIDRAEARRIGLDVYKVGMVWPLARDAALDFVRGKREVLVVEEKRGIIESAFKECFYDTPGRKPERMVGKTDEFGADLVPWVGELTPLQLASIVAARLDAALPGLNLGERARALARRPAEALSAHGAVRRPHFCSGCPHNSSTKVPEGSIALSGIGCHLMATWMDRNTESFIQMGGEGVNWVGRSLFNGNAHAFQNLGDGTFHHSGSLAIRQAVAAGTNITFKILYNDAVAMTGGQPVDGPLSVQAVAHCVRAEGVERIALVSDDTGKFAKRDLPPNTSIHDRADLDAVQRELREVPGVSVLIYDQICAAEKRRRRKRGQLPAAQRHVVINDLVCEGCGDCSLESNCLSVAPKETWLGRRRRIDQNSCNQDFSCLNGFCPSFVTLEGAHRRRPHPGRANFSTQAELLPAPVVPALCSVRELLLAGVGGTGVVTAAQLLAMSAHLEGKGASVLDFTGLSQKFGPVLSHVRLAPEPNFINQVRVEPGSADVLIGCDLVVSSSAAVFAACAKDRTRAVLNTAEIPTGDLVLHRDASLHGAARSAALSGAVAALHTLEANQLAERHLGDTAYANVAMLGFAWQMGLLPVSNEAMQRAIELNGVAVAQNQAAFALGRLAAADALPASGETPGASTSGLEAKRLAFLTDYQNAAYATRYGTLVARAQRREREVDESSTAFTQAVAASYFKLLTYKDEYEVARLLTNPDFHQQLAEDFTGDYKLAYHLAPPIFNRGKDARGRPRKRRFGPWLRPVLKVLARLKALRGTLFDPFGRTVDRRLERALIREFEDAVDRLLPKLGKNNLALAIDIARLPLEVRGFGPVKEAAAQQYRATLKSKLESLGSAQSAQAR